MMIMMDTRLFIENIRKKVLQNSLEESFAKFIRRINLI